MSEWLKGNTPLYSGWYWVTVDEAGNIKMYDAPMHYSKEKAWTINNIGYHKENIIAYIECKKPEAPYGETHFGFPDQYYLRVKCNGITRYLSKGFHFGD